MKKIILFASILFVAVVSTACINNLAVQDYHNKAQYYMDNNDYKNAIKQLKSGIELDPTIFEMHYNLAVAYTQDEDYLNAIEEFKKVISMKPEHAISYYSYASAQNNLAKDIKDKKIRLNEKNKLYKVETSENEETQPQEQPELTDKEKKLVVEYYNSAIANYEKFLELKPDAEEKSEAESQIQNIKQTLEADASGEQ